MSHPGSLPASLPQTQRTKALLAELQEDRQHPESAPRHGGLSRVHRAHQGSPVETAFCGVLAAAREIVPVTGGIFHCGARAQQLLVGGLGCPAACGILVPRPGMESATPVLGGRLLTTGPPGKSPETFPKPHLTFTCFTLSEKGFSGGAGHTSQVSVSFYWEKCTAGSDWWRQQVILEQVFWKNHLHDPLFYADQCKQASLVYRGRVSYALVGGS